QDRGVLRGAKPGGFAIGSYEGMGPAALPGQQSRVGGRKGKGKQRATGKQQQPSSVNRRDIPPRDGEEADQSADDNSSTTSTPDPWEEADAWTSDSEASSSEDELGEWDEGQDAPSVRYRVERRKLDQDEDDLKEFLRMEKQMREERGEGWEEEEDGGEESEGIWESAGKGGEVEEEQDTDDELAIAPLLPTLRFAPTTKILVPSTKPIPRSQTLPPSSSLLHVSLSSSIDKPTSTTTPLSKSQPKTKPKSQPRSSTVQPSAGSSTAQPPSSTRAIRLSVGRISLDHPDAEKEDEDELEMVCERPLLKGKGRESVSGKKLKKQRSREETSTTTPSSYQQPAPTIQNTSPSPAPAPIFPSSSTTSIPTPPRRQQRSFSVVIPRRRLVVESASASEVEVEAEIEADADSEVEIIEDGGRSGRCYSPELYGEEELTVGKSAGESGLQTPPDSRGSERKERKKKNAIGMVVETAMPFRLAERASVGSLRSPELGEELWPVASTSNSNCSSAQQTVASTSKISDSSSSQVLTAAPPKSITRRSPSMSSRALPSPSTSSHAVQTQSTSQPSSSISAPSNPPLSTFASPSSSTQPHIPFHPFKSRAEMQKEVLGAYSSPNRLPDYTPIPRGSTSHPDHPHYKAPAPTPSPTVQPRSMAPPPESKARVLPPSPPTSRSSQPATTSFSLPAAIPPPNPNSHFYPVPSPPTRQRRITPILPEAKKKGSRRVSSSREEVKALGEGKGIESEEVSAREKLQQQTRTPPAEIGSAEEREEPEASGSGSWGRKDVGEPEMIRMEVEPTPVRMEVEVEVESARVDFGLPQASMGAESTPTRMERRKSPARIENDMVEDTALPLPRVEDSSAGISDSRSSPHRLDLWPITKMDLRSSNKRIEIDESSLGTTGATSLPQSASRRKGKEKLHTIVLDSDGEEDPLYFSPTKKEEEEDPDAWKLEWSKNDVVEDRTPTRNAGLDSVLRSAGGTGGEIGTGSGKKKLKRYRRVLETTEAESEDELMLC
ncbi:hypothetical protein P7C70_g2881, partial [Phenoliferia sp. Uapishka_3]